MTKTVETLTCISCAVDKDKKHFYKTSSKLYEKHGKIPLCKACIKEKVDVDNLETVYSFLQQFDIMFDISYWESAIASKMDTLGRYMSISGSLPYFEGKGYKDSIFTTTKKTEETSSTDVQSDVSKNEVYAEFNSRDKDDVLRLLGYDPFEYENYEDKKQLYNRLVDFLDESTLEDGFKLQASIEIVKGFNQVDKINQAITNITNDADKLSSTPGSITALITAKKNILDSLMKLAAENGMSVKHNTEKSKGAGTLSGIIKTLQEKGIQEGELNLFDIETAQGMRQVADLSNESIMKQLQFDENDYTNMIMQQRDMIGDLEDKVIRLEEENRKIKTELMKYTKS